MQREGEQGPRRRTRDARPALVIGSGLLAAALVTLMAGPRPAALLLCAMTATWMMVPAITRFARGHGATVSPGGRSVHSERIPLLGGLAIFVTLLVGMLAAGESQALGLALGCTLMAGTGAFDDLYSMRPRAKILWQVVAALSLYAGGYRLPAISLAPVGSIATGALEIPMLVGWVLLVTNAVNLVDGIDGLATGVCLVVALGCVALGIGGLVPILLAGSLFGFLRFNLPAASIFLGDAGSLMLGFVLSALLLGSPGGMNLALALGLLALPLGDIALVTARRQLRGKPISAPDRGHAHHVLLRAWSGPGAVLAGLLAFCALAAISVIVAPNIFGLGVVASLWAIGVAYLVSVARLRWRDLFAGRRSFKRAHLLRRYAFESLRLADKPADVLPVLVRIAQDLGLASLSLRGFRIGREQGPNGDDCAERIECGRGKASWICRKEGGDGVLDDEKRAILCDLIRFADSILDRMDWAGPPSSVETIAGVMPVQRPAPSQPAEQCVHFIVSQPGDLARVPLLLQESAFRPVIVNTDRRDALEDAVGTRDLLPPDIDLDVDGRGTRCDAQVMERYDSLLDVLPPVMTVVMNDSSPAMLCGLVARNRGVPMACLAGGKLVVESQFPVPEQVAMPAPADLVTVRVDGLEEVGGA